MPLYEYPVEVKPENALLAGTQKPTGEGSYIVLTTGASSPYNAPFCALHKFRNKQSAYAFFMKVKGFAMHHAIFCLARGQSWAGSVLLITPILGA